MKIYRWLTLIAATAIAVIEAMMFTSGTTAAPQSGPQITVVTPSTAAATPLRLIKHIPALPRDPE